MKGPEISLQADEMGTLRHIEPVGSLIEQFDALRGDNRPTDIHRYIHRWQLTHELSKAEGAAGHVLHALTSLREKNPDDPLLKSEKAEPALRVALTEWAPKFAKLWEGKAHFVETILRETALPTGTTFAGPKRILSLVMHSEDSKPFDIYRAEGVIFTDAQIAIDEGALAILAETGSEGEKVAEKLRIATKKRDDLNARYFERRGIENAKRHIDWAYSTDTEQVRSFLSLAQRRQSQPRYADGLLGELLEEDRQFYTMMKEQQSNFIADTGMAVEDFKTFLFDLWLPEDPLAPPNHTPRWAKWLMGSLWVDVVAPQLEREIAREKENTLVPSGLITTLRDGRRDGGLILGPFGPWGEGGTPTIAVIPQKGISLFLSFDADVVQKGSKGTVSLRQAINGYQMRVLLASYTAWLDEGRDPGGKFIFDENIFLGDYLGLKHIARSDQKGLRFSSTTRKALRSAFDALRGIQVKSFGDIEASEPEPLIQQYHQKSTGKHLWYRHAPLLIDAVHEHYTQFPRAVLRQEANDAALSIGMASFVREKALVLMDHNGTHEAPLSYWLEKAGEDQTEGKRRLGNAYFQKASDRLKRATQEGEIGSFSGAGDRATSVLTFAADPKLLFAYEPLKKARGKRIKAARIGEAIAIANSKKAKG